MITGVTSRAMTARHSAPGQGDAPGDLPVAAAVAWWTTSWLRGVAAIDDVLDAVPVDVAWLADVRRSGATAVGLALPAEGDPVGLGGPPAFTAAALEAGQALVGDGGVGWVPHEHEGLVWWTEHPADRRQVPDLGEADRGLRAAVLESANALADLDVARWRPEVADEVLDLARPMLWEGPPGVPAPCVSLAIRGGRCLTIAALSLQDDGAAVSATEIALRRAALLPLERAARRAVVAGCSPEAWPPDRPSG